MTAPQIIHNYPPAIEPNVVPRHHTHLTRGEEQYQKMRYQATETPLASHRDLTMAQAMLHHVDCSDLPVGVSEYTQELAPESPLRVGRERLRPTLIEDSEFCSDIQEDCSFSSSHLSFEFSNLREFITEQEALREALAMGGDDFAMGCDGVASIETQDSIVLAQRKRSPSRSPPRRRRRDDIEEDPLSHHPLCACGRH